MRHYLKTSNVVTVKMTESYETTKPEISVVIPTFNREPFIQPLFECLAKQTFRDFECIVVDDGSTDKTAELCDAFAQNDKRFVFIRGPHGGVSCARNIGLDLAKGRYITFIDSDDSVPHDYLEKLYNNIKHFNVDIIVGSFCRIDSKKNVIDKISYPYESRAYSIDEIMPDFATRQKETGVFGRCWAKIFPSNYIADIRFDESLHLAEDFDFYLKLYPKIKTIFFDNTCEYGYSDAADNSSTCVKDKDINYVSQLRIRLRYKDFLESMDCFVGTNQEIVTEQIRNYIYFSIYHCDIVHFKSTFNTVRDLYLKSGVEVGRSSRFKTFVLKCVRNNQIIRLWLASLFFKIGRFLLRGHNQWSN